MIGALLTVYQGGTTTLAATFQDIGLTIPATNPLVADASGRIPLFFVADGSYALRLTDQNGIQSNGGYFYPQIPSIGASSSGGGGAPVDPTTVFSTGDVKWRLEESTIPGWVRYNGRTIGNASSGASERANADTQALFIYLYNTYGNPICPVPGGRGASALADYNSNHMITLLDARATTIFGLDDMGNAARNGFNGVPFSNGGPTTPGASGGEATHQLNNSEMPVHSHTGTTGTMNENTTHTHTVPTPSTSGAGVTGGGSIPLNVNISTTNSGVTNIDHNHAIPNDGGGAIHNNTPLFLLGTLFVKL